MRSLDKPNALRLITLFSGAVKGIAFYPASHPAIRQPLTELHKIISEVLSEEPLFSFGLVDDIMFLNEHLFLVPSTPISDLTNRLVEKDIGRIIITTAIGFDELETFIKLFSAKGVDFGTLLHQMAEEGITNLKLIRRGDDRFDQNSDGTESDPGSDHIATYNRALSVINTICLDIERGRIPNSEPLIKVVDQMVRITMHDPWALLGLTMIKDYDNYTFNHCVNVGVLAMALGTTLGMDALAVRDLGIAGQLHDIGKTMIPKGILNKPGKLSSAEFDEMKRHPELGSKIIREMEGLAPHIYSVVLGHHLHFNRSGYPEWANTLPGDRMIDIVAVADTYDAITTLRVYQSPVNPRSALNEMQKMSNTLLDGAIVERFVEMMGSYPVGTLVRLDTNEVALVYRPNPQNEKAPLVHVLIDGDGGRLPAPRIQELIDSDGARYAEIIAVVDPLLKNIDIGRLIGSGAY
ncbi:MAG: HD domain-containing protein [Desulfuromonadaceae bacterium]|nr:HD domain-containing protein [Desulfuromonadaceae bacterium]MDD2849421.1 HD domain-containing protein [Desulfuromonadaceae bacterium]MDD4130011.1 HD domain-containing protein [Desulfuromonadaceae bacterium]